MSQQLKYISRIKDEFDTVICGINGVFMCGTHLEPKAFDTLIKLYQSGKKIMLATNSGWRVNDIFCFLKNSHIPMHIFHAIISAGEIAHFYLKNNHSLGNKYYSFANSCAMQGLDYEATEDIRAADFLLVETDTNGFNNEKYMPLLQEAINRRLPLVCIGNNTSIITENGVCNSAGMLAEQYALQGGKIIPFGKPDKRIAAYLSENIADFDYRRCLIIGDCMTTDMRLGNSVKAQTLLITNGILQLKSPSEQQINELSQNYGLNIDYYMENLQW